MANLNKVQLIGNLTRDPELTYIPNGTAVVKTSIAVNENWTKDGEKRTSVQFINLTIWGKGGEIFEKYTSKGSPVYVEGKLKIDKVEKDGVTRYYTNVVVKDFQFLGRKGDGGGSTGAPLPEAQSEFVQGGVDPGFAGLPEGEGAGQGTEWEIPETTAALPTTETEAATTVDDMDIPF